MTVTRRAEAWADRGMFRLLRDRSIGGLFWGKLASTSGLWMHGVVASVVVYDATGSALMVGAIGAAQFLPLLVLAPWGGAMTDRGGGRAQILVGRVLCVLGALVIMAPLFVWGSSGDHVTPVVAAGSLVTGVGFVLGGPALQAVVPRMVTSGELASAMALNAAPMTISRVVGPLLGVLALAVWGAAGAFALVMACHLVFFALMVFVIRLPAAPARSELEELESGPVMAYLRGERRLIALLVVVVVATLGAEPTLTLAPALASEIGEGPGAVGVLSAAFGTGAIVGLLMLPMLVRRWQDREAVFLGLGVLGAAVPAAAFVDRLPALVVLFALAGLGFTVAVTAASTAIQRDVDERYRGRTMAIWLVAIGGARPPAAGLVGWSADATSVELACGIVGLVVVASALVYFLSTAWFFPRRRDVRR